MLILPRPFLDSASRSAKCAGAFLIHLLEALVRMHVPKPKQPTGDLAVSGERVSERAIRHSAPSILYK